MHGSAAVPIIVSVKSFSAYQVIVGSEEGLSEFSCGILVQKKKYIYMILIARVVTRQNFSLFGFWLWKKANNVCTPPCCVADVR